MTLEISWALLGMRFGLDATTRVFLAFTLLLWLLAALYAFGYVKERRRVFTAFFAATFAGNLGLVLAADGASFYLSFTVMTFAAYGLVVHDGTAQARRAGRVYISLAVLGEAFLLGGLILAASAASSLAYADLRAATAASPHRDLIVALLFAGFGVKAGAPGLHMWLPLAHPVAPTPASAVLSGAMIKAGLLGWLLFLPLGEAALPAWGVAVAALGLFATFYGAVAGVMQDEPKTVLAYSSVSQMGFMTVAVGAALAVPQSAPAAVTAATIYALHHGLAKGALFLGVSAVTRSPLLLAVLALPALALAGMPFTSGAAAKHALKDILGDWPTAATLLSFAAVGTTLLMARFLYLMRHREHQSHVHPLVRIAWLAAVAASLAAVATATMPGFSWADVWPVLVGAVLAAAFAALGGRWRRLRIPAGDLLFPLNFLADASFAALQHVGLRVGENTVRSYGAATRLGRALVERFSAASFLGEARLREAGAAGALVVLALLFLLAW